MKDVFVSYVEEDSGTACRIASGLERAGFSTWLYERDVLPGVSYLLQTGGEIAGCQAFVLLASDHSLGSNQVLVEIVRAHEERKPIIPLRLGISHAEMQRRQPEWRQALGPAASITVEPTSVESVVPRVLGGLQALAIQPKPIQPAPPCRAENSNLPRKPVDVFVSANSSHFPLVRELASYLGARGSKVFSTALQLAPSKGQFGAEVDEALDTARDLIVIGDPKSVRSGWVMYEWMSFHNDILAGRKRTARIVPVITSGNAMDFPRPLRERVAIPCDPRRPEPAFEAIHRMLIAFGGDLESQKPKR